MPGVVKPSMALFPLTIPHTTFDAVTNSHSVMIHPAIDVIDVNAPTVPVLFSDEVLDKSHKAYVLYTWMGFQVIDGYTCRELSSLRFPAARLVCGYKGFGR
jgi:hypothetical protein